MKLPIATRFVVALWSLAGCATLAFAVHRLVVSGLPGQSAMAIAAVFAVFVAVNMKWPLVVFLDGESEGFDLNEGFFVVLVLLIPSADTLMVFAVATIVGQALMRRPLIKSIFNVGQVLAAVGAGLLVYELINPSGHSIGYGRVGAALAGTAAFYIVNTNAVAMLLRTLGTPWRQTVFGNFSAKMLVVVGGVSLAIPIAALLHFDPRFLPLAIVPLFVVRHLATGHFYAAHDRARLRGLFEATLEINRSLGNDDARVAILDSARTLLRSSDAELAAQKPLGEDLQAPVLLDDGPLWLAVSGRSRTEPFDQADQALLDALASVGSVALANTELYEQVQREREKLSLITHSLGEGVCAVNAIGDITFMNPAGIEMLGWSVESPPTSAPHFLANPARRSISAGRSVTSDDTRFQRADGSYFPVTMTASPIGETESPSGAVIIFRDTSERKAFEDELARHAFQDALTGLANRRLLLDHLDQALLRARRSGQQVAVLFCDVDRFKVVNDNLGHQAGDEFLRIIADRLRDLVRPGDTLSRFGGDEFIVLLEGVSSEDGPNRVAEGILEALRRPVSLSDGHEVVATMSIGIAFSEEGKSRDDLLHDADVAMYRAKDRGRGGQFATFDVKAMATRSTERVDLQTELHRALERGEMEVYYQPLISLSDRRVIGAEALVRWNHPRHGTLLPAQFIELAEDSGLILPIGRMVMERACRQARAWHDALNVTIEIGVNLSARQFQQINLAEDIEEILRSTGVNPSQLCLEVTETLAMDDVELTEAILCKLHTLGVRVAIDDFGTGHSSLGYLARFPVDVVKIDQSFVREIEDDPVKSAIVSAVVALSRAIGSTTIVEGVETLAQLEHVRSLGCEVAQGFYFARPMTASAFGNLLVPEVSTRPDLRVVRDEALAG
jgi:diguanylate cyclase (GGDEF)-like protein/PAS domain S-box-containing protein